MNLVFKKNTDNYQSTDKVIKGIIKATDIIRKTYGPAGGNVIIEAGVYPYHRITNDGKTIIDSLRFSDYVENMGLNVMKEAGNEADRDSGDGRKTTMLLASAIFVEASRYNVLPMDLKKEFDECLPYVMKAIDDQKKMIGVGEVKSVATISSGNEMIGTKIQEIYEKIGREGIIEIDHSNFPDTTYEIVDGIRLRNAGYFGAYSCTEKDRAVYKNPKILITKDKITSLDQLEGLVVTLTKQGDNELVIYCDDIDMGVAQTLAVTHMQGKFKTLLIKSPVLWKDWLFEDFARITGATVIDSTNGKTFQNMVLSDLGTCSKIIATKDETRVIGIKDITDYVQKLKDMNTEESLLRASWLNTKVAILKVGASTESELSYISKKAKDACHASYLALKDGVVPGGGTSLFVAADSMPDTLAGDILREVLTEPLRQLCLNAGYSDRIPLFRRRGLTPIQFNDDFRNGSGLDIKNTEIVNMFDAGIIDASLVVKNAIRNALSIASTVTTTGTAITIPREKTNENTQQMPAMQ